MKLFLTLTAVLTLVATPALAVKTKKICPTKPEIAIPIFATEKPGVDFFYSTDPTQINGAVYSSGYHLKDSVGKIFHAQQPGTVALSRLNNPVREKHAYVTSSSESGIAMNAGYHAEGVLGYLIKYGGCEYKGFKVLPLHRLYNKKTAIQMLASDDAIRGAALSSGYRDVEVLGYVLAPL